MNKLIVPAIALSSLTLFSSIQESKPPAILYPISRPSPQESISLEALSEGINPKLLRAQAQIESAWTIKARSPKGAIGLFQIMPLHTLPSEACSDMSPQDLLNPILNARCYSRIIKRYYLASNRNLTRALRRYNGGTYCISHRCPESESYIKKVLDIFPLSEPVLIDDI